MYYVLKDVLTTNQIAMLGVLAAFILTFLMLKFPFPFLPKDQGRAFAVNEHFPRESFVVWDLPLFVHLLYVLFYFYQLPENMLFIVFCCLL